MIQVRRWIPMHADLARSMLLRFPVQSCSMCGFRTFHAKPQPVCFPALHAKLQVACFPGVSCKAAGRVLPGFGFPCECGFRQVRFPVESSFPCECCSRGVCLPGERACAGTLQTRAFFLCLYVRICPVTGALP